ncbi:MAG TPA: tetratricopeptide repeat protein [Bacteroidales bacterium]|nr:tetratricopeptide repeat protein [Bacteroidales bacterium]
MKKRILWVIINMNMFLPVFAIDADSLVQAGNRYYVSNDYQKAADTYQLVIDSGFVAPELYFNLGNAYYKMNNYALAILNYERALLLAPANKDIKFNLELANAHVVDKIDIIPEFFLKRWIRDLIRVATSNTWAIMSMSAFILFLILLITYLFSAKRFIKRSSFFMFILTFMISVICFVFSAQRMRMLEERQSAIIIAPSVTTKSSPDEYGTNLFILHEGTKVEVLDGVDLWNEIKIRNGNKGWIQKSAFERI